MNPQQFTDPKSILTIKALEAEFKKYFLMIDPYVIKMFIATIIANRIPQLDPLWLFLVAASSAGKTEIINTIEGLPFVFAIDTLTPNTFASGQQKPGEQTSLLHKLPGNTGIFSFKDFTVVLNMNPMAREEIMGQLRAIFDGEFVKRTGTGKDIMWKGKVGMVAAVTTIIHQRQAEFSAMGERFMQYEMITPDRRKVQEKIFERKKQGIDNVAVRKHLKACVQTYIEYVLDNMGEVEFDMDAKTQEEIFEIADYVTAARSGLEKDRRTGVVEFIPDAEMPTRVNNQLMTLAFGLAAINATDANHKLAHGESTSLPAFDMEILYKVSLDSIPRKRRRALQVLAEYTHGVTTKALAIHEHYATEIMRETLQELNALKLCERKADSSYDMWLLSPVWRDIVVKFEKIRAKDEALTADETMGNGYDGGEDMQEHNETMSMIFDNM